MAFQHKMGSMHHGMLLVVSEPTLRGRFDDQRCRPIRIPPWTRAQTALLTMLSVRRAIPCPQAQFTLSPSENHRSCSGPSYLRASDTEATGAGAGRACLRAAFVGTRVWKHRWFVVCCHACPMRPLVLSWAVLHDLGWFGCVLGEMHAMVCAILYGSVAV